MLINSNKGLRGWEGGGCGGYWYKTSLKYLIRHKGWSSWTPKFLVHPLPNQFVSQYMNCGFFGCC